MKKIKSLEIGRLHNEESFGFNQQVVAEASKLPKEQSETPDDPEEDRPVVQSDEPEEGSSPALTAAVNAHAAAVAEFDGALKDSGKIAGAAIAEAADLERDAAWRGTHNFVKAMMVHPDTAIQAVAEEVKALFDKYGDPTNLSQTEESGVLHNLLQDLTGVDSDKQATLGLAPWLTWMSTSEEAFLAAVQSRTEEEAARVVGLVKEKRILTESAYRKLVETVNAHVVLFGDAPYATFIDHVNVLIDRQKSILKTRKTNAAKKKEEEEAATAASAADDSEKKDG